MALADRLESAPRRGTGTPCSVGALEDYLASQPGSEADTFHAMLHTLGWSGRRIYEAVHAEAVELRQAGNIEAATVYGNLGRQTVNRHRSRDCRCFK